jgi:hypothetical protein
LAQAQAQAGDLVGAENYYQHAEHYFRSMSADREASPPILGTRGANFTRRYKGVSHADGPKNNGKYATRQIGEAVC